MERDDLIYVGHMLDTARKIEVRVQGKDRAAFDADEDFRIVLVHLVQVIGEAASRVSSPTRDSHPEIPWKQIVGMRHRIVHDYMHVDEDILWEVVTRNIPELINVLSPIVPE